ncbi:MULTISPECIES: histidine phosphatase family protein [Psychrilyobacter]|uniref:Histidine phosphatase family protein n=1 Tax=Psychrilyobacter piezotolerans TaxID=2293438 RepID=A0ABX9KFT6_9FUSO|nr:MULTISPECIES: histidine phosphatase family protein [Psychrilyobacter]MCS5423050.1 histidine phosphatase family protein [Psychrilyobacter sp. S5]NDI78796.1 histidine phosphatase family protein [Psychrilyobacter piezotolerans]RDE60895.1 histidine phosphatase family protein [Psychrilyobacter sp. S5]REI40684.1 histidine phosphatase family protein [Psychrilyobacter piezotolerans]
MLKIHFVRHGQTEWNVIKKLQGHLNSPLTEEGVEQTELLYEKLRYVDFSKIYTSPQGRALHTARILKGEKDIEILELQEIMEMGFGNVEGLEKEKFKEKHPEAFMNLWTDAVKYDPSDFSGESFIEVEKRAIEGLEKLVEENKTGDIMVVSHGMILKVIFGYVLGHGLDKFWIDPVPQNTSVTTISYNDGKFKMENFSNIDHLENAEEISYI